MNVEIKSFPESPRGLVERVLEVIDRTYMAREVCSFPASITQTLPRLIAQVAITRWAS